MAAPRICSRVGGTAACLQIGRKKSLFTPDIIRKDECGRKIRERISPKGAFKIQNAFDFITMSGILYKNVAFMTVEFHKAGLFWFCQK